MTQYYKMNFTQKNLLYFFFIFLFCLFLMNNANAKRKNSEAKITAEICGVNCGTLGCYGKLDSICFINVDTLENRKKLVVLSISFNLIVKDKHNKTIYSSHRENNSLFIAEDECDKFKGSDYILIKKLIVHLKDFGTQKYSKIKLLRISDLGGNVFRK